jgi:hypothetical protein
MQSPHAGIKTNIENVWLRPVLILEDGHSLGRYDFCYGIIGIPEISQSASTKCAAIHACWIHAFGNPVVTEVTFVRDLVHRMEEPDAIGASHNAVATADAPIPVNQDNAIVRLVGGTNRADLDAGRVVALVAELRNKKRLVDILGLNFFATNRACRESVSSTIRRICEGAAIFHDNVAFNPGSRYGRIIGNLVFVLAGFDAQSATDALGRIDQECPPDLRICYGRLGFVSGKKCERAQRQYGRGRPTDRIF